MNDTGKNALRTLVMLTAILAIGVGPTAAQDATDPGTRAGEGAGDLGPILSTLTAEQIEQMIEEANAKRLQVEREQVISEIRRGLLYDPERIDEAVDLLETFDAVARQDSVDRTNEALSLVDGRFAEAGRLLADGQAAEAVEAAKRLLQANETTFLSAAKYLLYADALLADGQDYEAIEAYRELLKLMPERISFAASAALRAAETYEQAGRMMYARDMYRFCLVNYGLVLTADEANAMALRLAELQEIYTQPLLSIADRMEQAGDQLAGVDSGADTQDRQQEAIRILEDLIQTLEENQPQGDSSGQPQQPRQQGQRQDGQEPCPTCGRQGCTDCQPRGGQQPSQPMTDSRIVPGELPETMRIVTVHDTDESGDWSQLPPRRQEEIQEIMQRGMSGRYRQLVADYHRWLAEQGMD